MAIGAIHLAWFRRLAERNVFSGLHSVVDLGPQDVQIERDVLAEGLREFISPEKLTHNLDMIYSDGKVNKNAQAAFYRLFGLDHYEINRHRG